MKKRRAIPHHPSFFQKETSAKVGITDGPKGTTEISRWRKPPESPRKKNEPRTGRLKIPEVNRRFPSPLRGSAAFPGVTGGLRHRLISSGPPGLNWQLLQGFPKACPILAGVLISFSPLSAQATDPAPITLYDSIVPVTATAAPGPTSPATPFISRAALKASESAATMRFEVALKMRNLQELEARVNNGEHVSSRNWPKNTNPSPPITSPSRPGSRIRASPSSTRTTTISPSSPAAA